MKAAKHNQLLTYLGYAFTGVIIFLVGIIVAMHSTGHQTLLAFRVPTYLREIDPYIGYVWPRSMTIYHVILVVLGGAMFAQIYGLFQHRQPMYRTMSYYATLISLFSSWLSWLFFLSTLTMAKQFSKANQETAIIFSVFSSILVALNIVTILAIENRLTTKKLLVLVMNTKHILIRLMFAIPAQVKIKA